MIEMGFRQQSASALLRHRVALGTQVSSIALEKALEEWMETNANPRPPCHSGS